MLLRNGWVNIMSKRKIIDNSLKAITYFASAISVLILISILWFIFNRGHGLLSFDILISDYEPKVYIVKLEEETTLGAFEDPHIEDAYFSSRYGVAFKDDLTKDGVKTIRIVYLDEHSKMFQMIEARETEASLVISEGMIFNELIRGYQDDGASHTIFSREGAMIVAQQLDTLNTISSWQIRHEGGGLRGSILTTLYLIFLTLFIALPLGIAAALYLHELAPQNKITNIIRSFVDMLTGVPSIIYGLMGLAFFVPMTAKLFNNPNMMKGSILAGSLTLAVIILPVIIKATESALDVVPKSYKEASLALGANVTQTTFKVMLPNAAPGILSAALLGIGRIMGESAALIYAMGTVINDKVSLTGQSTSLAVHIWSVMDSDTPNLALASTIAIIILIVVLALNIFVKLLTFRFMKKYK